MTKTISIADATPHHGNAYRRVPGHPDPLLTLVGKGTPAGEYLRRYWHPVGLSKDVTERPQKVRLLGEDLVLFRDQAGRPGLLYPRCAHRGTSLYYGKVEERGIRCCYHGWLFGVDGTCHEQPCEPDGGRHRGVVRQPWYPVQERYGIVFAYLGPPEKKPVLPRYDIFEDLKDGEFIEHVADGFGGYLDNVADPHIPYHWLQHWENIMDPYHVVVLHHTFSGTQFADGFHVMPRVDFEAVDDGVVYQAWRDLPNGRKLRRVNAVMLPNISATPSIELAPGRSNMLEWHVPVDDTHFRCFIAARVKTPGFFAPIKVHNGKGALEATADEKRDFPGDFEAQSGQGAITLHSEEHLATSDRGVVLLRRLMKQQIAAVEQGRDPAGVHFTDEAALVRVRSGNFYGEAAVSK